MLGFVFLVGYLGLAAAAGIGGQAPPDDPVLPGPYVVASSPVVITNSATGDQLKTDLYYPALNGGGVDPRESPYATVVFAPAFIAQPVYYAERGRHLASRGYIVAIPQFPNEDLEARAADIQQVFSYLEQENARPDSLLFGKIDRQRFGLSGHSLGGVGTLMVAARDPRIKVGVALDPVNPPPLLGRISPALAASHGNVLAAAFSAVLRGRGAALCGAFAQESASPSWDYTLEEPNITIPLAIIGGQNGCRGQFNNYANYRQMYPALEAQHRALYVLPDGWHCDFLYTDSSLAPTFCYLLCGGSRSLAREQLVERYLTAWFEYYLRGKAEYYAYIYGANVAADVQAGRVTADAHSAPSGLAAEGQAGEIRLTWNMPDYLALAGYNIYRRQEGGTYSAAPYAQVGRAVSYLDRTVEAGQTYFYRLASRDAAGNEHQPSAEVQAKAMPSGGSGFTGYFPLLLTLGRSS